jgi:hypothetical protein
VIKSIDVKSILVAAKLMKNTKNASGMVNGIIARSEAFERIGRGEYRLKDFKDADTADYLSREDQVQ